MDTEETKQEYIEITGARENNLRNVNVSIPRNKFTVITGLSGSGKSSLALDTIYSEGIRRYIECLSTYARQFLDRIDKPDFDDIKGLPTAISIESRNNVRNSRSTVGTTTEIYDYLRLLFAKIGSTYCPECDLEIREYSPQMISAELLQIHEGKRAIITISPESGVTDPDLYLSEGFSRIFHNGSTLELEEVEEIPGDAEIVIDRIVLDNESTSRITESVETGFAESDEIFIHVLETEIRRYTKGLECNSCRKKFSKPTPNLFSFNSPQGACQSCNGFGNILDIDPKLVIPNPEKSISEGAVEPFTKPSYKFKQRALMNFARDNSIDTKKPFKALTKAEQDMIFNGDDEFNGVRGFFRRLEEKSYKMHVRVMLSRYRSGFVCPECQGSRLKESALWVKIADRSINDLTELSVDQFSQFFRSLSLTEYEKNISEDILREINARTGFLLKVGLNYLTLSRLTRTLSGGEAQRINLACQMGSRLTETLYILDEPSIGLHPRDIDKLISIINELKSRNNTVIVVEHDYEMITASDYIVELGPEAGEHGGEIVFQGYTSEFIKSGIDSYTRKYINDPDGIKVPEKRRKGTGKRILINGASENNLKDIDVSIPLGTLCCITGVSGSGKSSLVKDVLYNHLARKFRSELEKPGNCRSIEGDDNLKDVIMLDQSPVGRSSRSNPVTYIKVYDEIRKIVSGTLKARLNGLKPSDFSFNVKGGRCEECKGEGKQKVEMHFLADVIITCPDCKGKRFKQHILDYRYRDKNIDEILDLTVNEALLFFSDNRKITNMLGLLRDVGLGYIRLGQPAITLSGGEAQRLKIARELGKKGGKDILYILDEPTVGLHAEDIKKLISVLNRLVDNRNTAVIIEHNLDLVKCADHIIDLGPEGGDNGGNVVVHGKPEEIVESTESYTAKYLKKYLS